MFLSTANNIGDVLTHGVEPCIEFLDLIEDLLDEGDEDKAIMLLTQTKGKLYQMKSVLNKIDVSRKIAI